ncbi:hypothetical protein ACS86_10315 [Vibrio alginolyticus]|nr:hypothetical protein ACS86_10315 [Vibrio alginolyticus]
MKGNQAYSNHKDNHFFLGKAPMTHVQFESLKSQLHHLTPQQLRSLQNEIQNSLEKSCDILLTDEEISVISSLFRNQ